MRAMRGGYCAGVILLLVVACFSLATSSTEDELWEEILLKNWMSMLRSMPDAEASAVVQNFKKNISTSNSVSDFRVINLKGLISYSEGRFLESLGHFESASLTQNFSDQRVLSNWLDAWYTIDASSPLPKLRKLVMQYPDSVPLLQSTIDEIRREDNDESYTQLVETVRTMPTWYEFWMVFVDIHLKRYFIAGDSGTSNLDQNGSNLKNEFGLVQFALTLFPRSPELLLLRAVHLILRGDYFCGNYFALASLSNQEYEMKVISRKYYDSVTATAAANAQIRPFNEIADSHKGDTAEFSCLPFLTHHTVETYQKIYKRIREVMGAGWSALKNVSVPAGTEPGQNNLVSHGVVYAYPKSSESELKALPSLQVGCTSVVHCAMPGFLIADIVPSIVTHFVATAYNLSMIQSHSIGLIYSSHTLSLLSYHLSDEECPEYPHANVMSEDVRCLSELDRAFHEFRRILVDGGKVLISEPDFAALAAGVRRRGASAQDKFRYMEQLMGGHQNMHDIRKSGFHFEMLNGYLFYHGFCKVTRVSDFGLFRDQSRNSDPPSVNVMAVAC